MTKDEEWMALVCYARAAGARSAEQAGHWAQMSLVILGDWRTHCEYIDGIAETLRSHEFPH